MDLLQNIRIDALAHGGSSVARTTDGRVVFVRGGCPGDVVDATVTADKKRFLEAEVTTIREPSPERRTPPCPYFGSCGGCQWQHVSHAVQLRSKRDQVVDALTRIGHFVEPPVADMVTGASPYGYRNRIDLSVGRSVEGRPAVGMTAAGSDRLVPIDSCLLLPERARRAPKALAGAIRYLAGRSELGVDRVSLRVAANTRDLEIGLWGPPGALRRTAVSRTLGDAVRATSITRVLVKDDARKRANLQVEVLAGKGHWREKLGPYTYRVSTPSFFQVNTETAALMVEYVMTALRPDGSDRVLDLYAGVGTFTLPLAALAGDVVAIEGTGSAVRDLRANLEEADLWAEVMPGDAERALAEAGAFDMAVVDPPRAGMTPGTVQALAGTGARRICYVSCDPATLARDARALADLGYRLVSVVPFDLFPQTWHVETVTVMERDPR